MKTNLFIVLLLGFLNIVYGQSEAEKQIITKIEKEILDKKIKKIEFKKPYSDKVIIYLKSDTPTFIQVENHITTINHYTNGDVKEEIDLKIIKFYIQNWKKKKYIIVGPQYFELDRTEIEKIIANNKKNQKKTTN